MFQKMKAINYNILMTLMELVKTESQSVAGDYGINNTKLTILPAYPRDLSKMTKPSIIVQMVDLSQSKLGMTGFAGQFRDDDNTISDVYAIEHSGDYQIDIVADSNISCALITAMVTEGILNTQSIINNGKIKLFDFTSNQHTDIGVIKLISSIDIVSNDSSTFNRSVYDGYRDRNHDYITSARFGVSVIQSILPTQDYVDLSKWLKFKQSVKLC